MSKIIKRSGDKMLGDSVKTLVERIRHPILGGYLLSLAVLNWKVWLMCLSGDEHFEYRIERIEQYLQSTEFTRSLWQGFCGLVVYLYLLPFLTSFFISIRRKIQLMELRWDLKFQVRLDSEKRIGGDIEVIATDLKNQADILGAHARQMVNFLDTHIAPHNFPNNLSKEATILTRNSMTHLQETEEYLKYCQDILKNSYAGTPLNRIKEFHDNRNRK